MSNFEKLEDKDKMIEKGQNAINDFIANLDEDVYKDVNNFPLKYPEKITYPESIKMDDFIILSVKDEFYLFPKIFEDKISDYVEFKKYFAKNECPKETKYLQNFIYIIEILLVLSPFVFAEWAGLFIILFVYFLLELSNREKQINEYTHKEKEFAKFLSELREQQFPLEFFEKNNVSDILIYPQKSELAPTYAIA